MGMVPPRAAGLSYKTNFEFLPLITVLPPSLRPGFRVGDFDFHQDCYKCNLCSKGFKTGGGEGEVRVEVPSHAPTSRVLSVWVGRSFLSDCSLSLPPTPGTQCL